MDFEATSPRLRNRLEQLSDRAMPGSHRDVMGSWRLRAALAVTGRANSAWPAGSPNCPLPEAVDRVERWYRRRNLTPQFQMFDDADEALISELDARDWEHEAESVVMASRLEAAMAAVPSPTSRRWTVTVSGEPSPLFAELLGDGRRLEEVTTTALPQRFVTVVDDRRQLLGGGMTTIDGEWAGILSMKTQPEARRRGVASTVIRQLADSAMEQGAQRGWLQVQADNIAAVTLYERLGFETAHRYRYRFQASAIR